MVELDQLMFCKFWKPTEMCGLPLVVANVNGRYEGYCQEDGKQLFNMSQFLFDQHFLRGLLT